MTTRFLPHLSMLLLLAVTIACDRSQPLPDSNSSAKEQGPAKDIWRNLEDSLSTDAKLNANEPGDPTALRTRVYGLPYHVAYSLQHAESDTPTDPFAPNTERRPPATLEKRLSGLGIDFPAGTSVVYSDETTELIVTHDLPHLTKIEEILKRWDHRQTRLVNHRVEVFQLPAALTIELSDSAATNSNHQPEWEAVKKLVQTGQASVVASIGASLLSGQRSKVLAAEEFIFVADYSKDEKTSLLEPVFETREVGTTLELDSVLGADGESIDLNFLFEYHSAPPSEETIAFRYPGSNRSTQIQAPIFHAHKIQTQVTTKSGDVILIGSWRPTGKPEFEANDLMQVAFLKSDVYTVGGVQRLR